MHCFRQHALTRSQMRRTVAEHLPQTFREGPTQGVGDLLGAATVCSASEVADFFFRSQCYVGPIRALLTGHTHNLFERSQEETISRSTDTITVV